MLVNFGYVAVLSFGAAAATEQGTGIASLVIPVFGIGVILSRTILAGIPDRFGAPRTLVAAVTIESAGLAGMAATTSTPVALVSLAVMAVGQGLAVPSLGMLALQSVPPSRHGRTAGAFFAYFDAGVGLGGPAVGLAAHAADPTGGLFAAAGAVLATAPVALLARARAATRGGPAAVGLSRAPRGDSVQRSHRPRRRRSPMARELWIRNGGGLVKIRNPWAVALLPFVTFGIYHLVWWYRINRELRDFGYANNAELGDSPALSTLALFPGGLIIVPALVSYWRGTRRVQLAARVSVTTPPNGWIAVLLFIFIPPAFSAYLQVSLNKVWRSSWAT